MDARSLTAMSDRGWTDLGGGLRVRQSVAFQMNSTLLLDGEDSVLVDPGVLPAEIDDIARVVEGIDPENVTLLFTHAHWDHVLARPWWPDAETLAHDRFITEVRRDAARIVNEAENLCRSHSESWGRGFTPFAPDHAVSGLHFTRLGPWRLVLRDAPGHSTSQITVHLPDHATLIAADMLSDIEIPLLDGPCAPYRRTLADLMPLVQGGAIRTLIPGHGTIARGTEAALERLTRDQSYLERLEAAVQKARRDRLSRDQAVEKLADMEYAGAPLTASNQASHLENIGFAFDGTASAPAAESRGAKGRPSPEARRRPEARRSPEARRRPARKP